MTYSGHQLLPHLKVLQHQYLSGLSDDDEKFRSAYFDLELLPYSLGGTWHALSELARIQNDLIAKYPREQLQGAAFLGLATDERDLLSFMVDNFLDASSRAQNSVIHYLSRGLSRSLPSSFSDLVKKMESGRVKLPRLPHDETLNYWAQFGRQLRDYRDLAQHHALATSDARLVPAADGRIGVYLLLPSNPEAKSAGKLVFCDPEVHAFPFALRQFKALVMFLGWLTRGLVSTRAGDQKQAVFHVFRDPATIGPGVRHRAHVPPSANELKHTVDDWLKEVRARGG